MEETAAGGAGGQAARWRRFLRDLVATIVLLGGGLYLAVVLIDPFDALHLSPPLPRVPIDANQRFSYPALARSPNFDSAVIGTSTSRLLRPAQLDELFDARFANLAMNSATAYEQARMIELFVRHHPDARYLVIGLDAVWCEADAPLERYTERPFPEWLYDDDPWNDYAQHFDLHAVEQAGRQLATMIGLRPVKRGLDGYTDFLPDDATYDPGRARRNLWGDGPAARQPADPPTSLSAAERAALDFPSHSLLAETLARLPAETQALLFFVPYHLSAQPPPRSRAESVWAECKLRIAALAAGRPNSLVLDFMRPSAMTATDENYWDPLHYRIGVAADLARQLYEASRGAGDDGRPYRLLAGTRVQTDAAAER